MGSSSGWFVVMGGVIALVGSLGGTWISQWWGLKREQAERAEKAKAKSIEFQERTFLEIQDAMAELVNAACHRQQLTMDEADDQVALIKSAERLLIAQINTRKLQFRIRDAAAREMVNKFVESASTFAVMKTDADKVNSANLETVQLHWMASDEIGVRQESLGEGEAYVTRKPFGGTLRVTSPVRQSWPAAGSESCVVPG